MRRLGVILIVGVLAVGAFWAYGSATTWLDVFNVNEALAEDETAVLLGWSTDPGALYVVCAEGGPRRILASWERPDRHLNLRMTGTAQLAAYNGRPQEGVLVEFPASEMSKGERRELIQTQPLDAETVASVSDVLGKDAGYRNAFNMGEAAFYFSSNTTAQLGLLAACQDAAPNGIEGQANG